MTKVNLQKEKYIKGKPVILIVEDNFELLAFLQESLSVNYNIYYALNGERAMQKLFTIPLPDIIISDIMMNKMDGYELYDKLMTNNNYKTIPFIFLTAKNSPDERIEYLEKGIVDYIVKPFSIHELEAKIKSILKNSSMIRLHEKDTIRERVNRAIDMIDIEIKSKKELFYEKCFRFMFSPREREVAFLLSTGLYYKEIADQLHIHEKTVSTHVQRIYTKTKTNNKVEFLNLFTA
jgi:DNA-binding NarL/FixJ family response regulator